MSNIQNILILFRDEYMGVKIKLKGTSLVAQWLRPMLPMQGTQVWSLVRKLDSTCSKIPSATIPGGSVGKESACNAGDLGLIPG